jgi:predicted Zn-dependent peptidase
MLTRGTSQHTKGFFAEEVEGMGARLDSDHSRERQSLTVRCFKGDVSRAVQLLGDSVSNATLDPAELELAKAEVADEHEKNHTDYEKTTLEQVQYNAFREH